MENMQMIGQTLMMSIFEVFEKMFYIFLEPIDNNGWEHRWTSSIKFSGPMNGEIKAYFSQSLSDAMVQNMLNIESGDITEKLREDCLKESVNMICGNFLRKYDSAKVFDLSLPCFSDENVADLARDTSSGDQVKMDFEANEGMLGLCFTVPKILG